MTAQKETAGALGTPPTVITKEHDTHFAALAAKFKAKGHELHQLRAGSFLASRWGFTRELTTLADAEVFLIQVGGGT
jgi:hypothetical protein